MAKQCRDLCKNERWHHCHIGRYEDGNRQCLLCNICYKPSGKQPPLHCYCCGTMLRGRPQNKKNFKHHMVWMD